MKSSAKRARLCENSDFFSFVFFPLFTPCALYPFLSITLTLLFISVTPLSFYTPFPLFSIYSFLLSASLSHAHTQT